MIHTDFSFYLFAALLLLLLPLDWLLAVVLAALFHEFCHMLAVWLMGGRITAIRIKSWGCVMETGEMGQLQQFFGILAGPVGSFLLLTLCHGAPKLAICGLLQGLCNLIPILPLDGGRLLRLLLQSLCPKQAENILDFVTFGFCMFLDGLAIWFSFAGSPEPLLSAFALIWNLRFLSGKIPCKPTGIRVQ